MSGIAQLGGDWVALTVYDVLVEVLIEETSSSCACAFQKQCCLLTAEMGMPAPYPEWCHRKAAERTVLSSTRGHDLRSSACGRRLLGEEQNRRWNLIRLDELRVDWQWSRFRQLRNFESDNARYHSPTQQLHAVDDGPQTTYPQSAEMSTRLLGFRLISATMRARFFYREFLRLASACGPVWPAEPIPIAKLRRFTAKKQGTFDTVTKVRSGRAASEAWGVYTGYILGDTIQRSGLDGHGYNVGRKAESGQKKHLLMLYRYIITRRARTVNPTVDSGSDEERYAVEGRATSADADVGNEVMRLPACKPLPKWKSRAGYIGDSLGPLDCEVWGRWRSGPEYGGGERDGKYAGEGGTSSLDREDSDISKNSPEDEYEYRCEQGGVRRWNVLIEYIVCVGGWEGRAPLERFGGSRHLTRELFIHMDTPEFIGSAAGQRLVPCSLLRESHEMQNVTEKIQGDDRKVPSGNDLGSDNFATLRTTPGHPPREAELDAKYWSFYSKTSEYRGTVHRARFYRDFLCNAAPVRAVKHVHVLLGPRSFLRSPHHDSSLKKQRTPRSPSGLKAARSCSGRLELTFFFTCRVLIRKIRWWTSEVDRDTQATLASILTVTKVRSGSNLGSAERVNERQGIYSEMRCSGSVLMGNTLQKEVVMFPRSRSTTLS
ncbi:hypothetical protein EDD17DRAFT_1899850 [Pisolithus thermaeus]|nr:hypothetical protein EDD17DRAFT_1899850 [Pisolithus thermaeus]